MNKQPAFTLHCPNCGAPCAPEAVRCEYCKSRLATVSCPHCFGLLFQGAAYCPHCGEARSRTEGDIKDKPIRCAACRANMRWVKIGETDLLECEKCDATWVEAAAFERLCADRDAQAAVLHKGAAPQSRPLTDRVRYRPCPRCGKLMNRINFSRLSGTVVDVCRGHGTFMDRGELHEVVQFILDGGLERWRRRHREELAEEERRIRSGLARASEPSRRLDETPLQALLSALMDVR